MSKPRDTPTPDEIRRLIEQVDGRLREGEQLRSYVKDRKIGRPATSRPNAEQLHASPNRARAAPPRIASSQPADRSKSDPALSTLGRLLRQRRITPTMRLNPHSFCCRPHRTGRLHQP